MQNGTKEAKVAQMLGHVFASPNESDRNGEAANMVDGLFAIARAIHHLAAAVEKPLDKLAEAVDLLDIIQANPADAIHHLADAVKALKREGG